MSFPPYPTYRDSGIDWIGPIPQHWQVIPLARVASQPNSLFIDGDWVESKNLADEGIRYITTGNVGQGLYKEQGEGYVSQETFNELQCTEVIPGDILISRLNLPIGRACIVPDLGERIITSVDNVIARADDKYLRSYLVYMLSSASHFANMEVLARGTTMQRISRSVLGHVRFALPDLDEQEAIATLLDRETTKIDALIAEQQRQIELLQEKRQAVISHAVTKGLNPNAPMKDSGVEWLGKVPEHWSVRRLRYIGTLQNGLNIGAEAFGEGDPFISYGDVYNNPNVPTRPAGLVRSTPEDKRKYGLEEGDVLFTRTSEAVDDIGVASTCLAQVPNSTFAGFLIRLRPFQGELEPRYSTYLFRNQGVKKHFAGTMNIVTRASLSQGELGGLCLCLPPLEEQLEIAIYIEEMTEKSEELISSARNLVSLLQERRSALISAAVTGRIDVRELETEVVGQ
jgi:type I restriction enzyme S subunit